MRKMSRRISVYEKQTSQLNLFVHNYIYLQYHIITKQILTKVKNQNLI